MHLHNFKKSEKVQMTFGYEGDKFHVKDHKSIIDDMHVSVSRDDVHVTYELFTIINKVALICYAELDRLTGKFISSSAIEAF